MIIKTEALAGPALDWAVWFAIHGEVGVACNTKKLIHLGGHVFWRPSNSWEQLGPLIELYEMDLTHSVIGWSAVTVLPLEPEEIDGELLDFLLIEGETPLVAACRAIVAAELGSEVDIPEELL